MSKLQAYIKSVPTAPIYVLETVDVPMGVDGVPFPVYQALVNVAPFERRIETSALLDLRSLVRDRLPGYLKWVAGVVPEHVVVKMPVIVGVKTS